MQNTPTDITLKVKSRILLVEFDDGAIFELPFEYLRVHSPSAEVKGHGPGQEVLQVGKEDVNITDIQPMGHYAIRLIFSDGHDTGLYTWDYLYELGTDQASRWQAYLDRLKTEGYAHSSTPDI